MRLYRAKPDRNGHFQTFYGGCNITSGDHPAGNHVDVCNDCCETECKRIAGTTKAAA